LVWVRWLILRIPATWEAEIGRIMVSGCSKQKISEIPSQQTSWGRKVWGMALEKEGLLSKCKTLSSTSILPPPTKNFKKVYYSGFFSFIIVCQYCSN
jgi:hypothetical protein